MLTSDRDWRRARWRAAITLALGLALLLLAVPLANGLGVELRLIRIAGCSALGVGLMTGLMVLRKPQPLADYEVEALERNHSMAALVSTIGILAALGAAFVTFLFPMSQGAETVLGGIAILGTLLVFASLPVTWRHSRASLVAPELFDERSRQNQFRAGYHGGRAFGLFAFVMCLALNFDLIEMEASDVALSLGIVWLVASTALWHGLNWWDAREANQEES